MSLRIALPTVLTALLVHCGQGGGDAASADAGDAAAAPLSDEAVEALAAQYPALPEITTSPFATRGHQGNPLVRVYANSVARPLYSRLGGSGLGPAGFELPRGSLLVKEMLAPDGGPPILTAMYKQPPGYDPQADDWWFGRLRSDGAPTDPAYVGRVGFCISCHMGASSSDFAWGVPAGHK